MHKRGETSVISFGSSNSKEKKIHATHLLPIIKRKLVPTPHPSLPIVLLLMGQYVSSAFLQETTPFTPVINRTHAPTQHQHLTE